MKVTIKTWDEDTDMTQVFHDGVLVWTDTMGHFDQYLKFSVPEESTIELEVISD
jgi:hypothetical protein